MKEGASATGASLPVGAGNNKDNHIATPYSHENMGILQEARSEPFSFFSDFGLYLHRRGFQPIPVQGKKPVLPSWPVVTINETNINGWIRAGYGDCNVSIRNQPALDLDITHEALAKATEDKIREMLGPIGIRYGKKPKGLVIVQCEAPRKMQSPALVDPATGDICRIEYLAIGQQFVVFGIHPDTNEEYVWKMDEGVQSPLKAGPAAAPVIKTEQIQELFDWFEQTGVEMGLKATKKRSTLPPSDPTLMPPGQRSVVRSEIRTAIDQFNHNGFDKFVEMLTEQGWAPAGRGAFEAEGETVRTWLFTRPGKDTGVSASLYCSPRTGIWQFQNWSTSVDGLEADTAYIGHVYAAIYHDGNYGRAAQALTKMGFEPKRRSAEEDFENLVAMAEAAALEEINRLHDQGALTDEAGIGVIIDHRLNAPAANHVLEHLVKLDVGKKRPLSKLLRDRQEHIQRQEGEARVSEQAGDRAIMEWAETQKHESTLAAAQILASKVEDGELYLHGGVLVQVQSRPPRKMVGIDGSTATAPSIPVFLAHNHHSLVLLVDKHTAFVRTTEKKVIGVPVPGELPELLTNCPDLPVRSVQGLAYVPQVGPDGTYWGDEGFDPESELHFEFGGAQFLPPLEGINTPTEAKARCVDHLVGSFLNGFTFADDVDKGVALAALLTALIRRQIGLAPGFLFRASMQGSGKTTLGRKIFIVVTGGDLAVMTLPRDHEEFRKAITSVLLESAPVIVFDNLPDGLEIAHPGLARLITSTVHKDRLLGGNQQVELPARTTVILTGNNIVADSDNARRFLPCQLQPGCENPERRRFENADVYHHALLNRPQIIQAALSLIKGYLGTLSAGDAVAVEASKAPPSGFPEWDRMVRFPLLWAMGVDVLEAIDRSKNTSADLLAKQTVLLGLYEIFPDQEFSASEVLSRALCCFDSAQLPGEGGGRGRRGSAIGSARLRDALYQVHGGFADNTRTLGWALRKMDGFTHAGLTMRSRVVHSANRYRVSRVEVDKGV